MNSKKVLILGANGMLGKMMSLYFSSLNDYSTVLTSRESSNFLINNFDDNVEVFNVVEDDFQALASKVKPDIIINSAAKVGGIYSNNKYKAEYKYECKHRYKYQYEYE